MDSEAITERSWVEIDLSAFRANLNALKSFLAPGQGFIQIVKADAYGHGALEIARVSLSEGASGLGVANLEEGKLLRIQGSKAPIIVLSPSLPAEIPGILEYGLTPSVSDLAFADKLSEAATKRKQKCKVHLKLDSGMHRSGALADDFVLLYEHCQRLPGLEIEGVFSHFASGESDPDYCRKQENRFHRLLKRSGIDVKQVHLANSSALINGFGRQAGLCRLGILSFGVYTAPGQQDLLALQPVMRFKSVITQIKEIPRNSGVGYNLTWKAKRRTKYAIIPVGYADGYDFLLSNRGQVSVLGKACPVIGLVSMDMISVDITEVPAALVGTEVTLLGGAQDCLRAENLASAYSGSAYELLCQVGRRAKRYYYEEGRMVTSAPLARRDFVSSDYSDSKLSQIIQAAISQRLNSNEIGELISREILRAFFFNKDREILYRSDFVHRIEFAASPDPKMWQVRTTLSFRKVLQNDYFTVACATSEAELKSYFKRRDVEYRWLMDANFDLSPASFQLSAVRVDKLRLDTRIIFRKACMELRCTHPDLPSFVGKEVSFQIDTLTYYPKSSHQLSVFITELTRGVKISFHHPAELANIECVPVFSGQNKYPRLTKTPTGITVSTNAGEWVFPQSGVVFAY